MRHPHLTPPQLPTTDEGRTEGEGRQEGLTGLTGEGGGGGAREGGRPVDLHAGGRPAAEGVREGGESARGGGKKRSRRRREEEEATS
jgi:hypothetical protein